ncbi:Uncharacterised protein [Zhongshania aliphaticivorans]|uniref:Proteophosphoglycan n=1 Tax=Zhongshania aliphaticivorans TaxID=1470434 RepID=A0A5S9NYQ0_9GAMM|nr:DUF1285 domain-containing protein [Zhongshania aliphaticivorans]CAA0089279.1 Uncharacterised protein [Zhongshania aliphaticivorans]CAA0095972.1 Uncharacterised protein [Zhongshania aliphaticivorans]
MPALPDIETLLNNQKGAPPLDNWHPELSGDIDIIIKSDGRWLHEGVEIKRHKLVKLFASILRREADQEYYLVTPVEKWRISVEDLPLQIIDFEVEGTTLERRILVKTNVDTWFELDAIHSLEVSTDPITQEPKPAVTLNQNLQGRVARACFYNLLELAELRGDDLILRAAGQVFELGRAQ